ncbi:MAG: LUD domain-containing protein [Deltaproteobacteria bacterium]|nr:LUD domain-containing protein [Deltaproteobacteria bacterium]
MSESRNAILTALRAARPPAAPAIRRIAPPPMPKDAISVLRDRVEAAGGSLETVRRDRLLSDISWPIELETTQHLFSTLPEIESRGVGADAKRDHDLARLELCVIEAEFAVVENGAAWQVPDTPRCRTAALLAEHLIVVVDAEALVPTLHQAYARIDLAKSSFGWFLCGPSKTADIEQALVLGAHGPRTMSLILASS